MPELSVRRAYGPRHRDNDPTIGALPALVLGAGGLTLGAALVTYLYFK